MDFGERDELGIRRDDFARLFAAVHVEVRDIRRRNRRELREFDSRLRVPFARFSSIPTSAVKSILAFHLLNVDLTLRFHATSYRFVTYIFASIFLTRSENDRSRRVKSRNSLRKFN